MRTQKGITLVALIITIVVLLILAVVAVATLNDTQIINHAGNTGALYNNAVGTEINEVGVYNNYLSNHMPQ